MVLYVNMGTMAFNPILVLNTTVIFVLMTLINVYLILSASDGITSGLIVNLTVILICSLFLQPYLPNIGHGLVMGSPVRHVHVVCGARWQRLYYGYRPHYTTREIQRE